MMAGSSGHDGMFCEYVLSEKSSLLATRAGAARAHPGAKDRLRVLLLQSGHNREVGILQLFLKCLNNAHSRQNSVGSFLRSVMHV